jgi:hypothetical protein
LGAPGARTPEAEHAGPCGDVGHGGSRCYGRVAVDFS